MAERFTGGDILRRQVILAVDTAGATTAMFRFQGALTHTEAEMQKLADSFARGSIKGDDYIQQMGSWTRQAKTLEQALVGVKLIQDKVGLATERATKQANATSRAVLEFSRGLEDFTTAGWIGALNNVPTMFYNIGQSLDWSSAKIGWMTTGVSLAATTAYTLYTNWGLVMKLFGLGLTKTEAERMEELGRQTHKTADEQRELVKLKERHHEIEKLMKMESESQREFKGEAEKAIGELGIPGGKKGGERVVEGLMKSRAARGGIDFSKLSHAEQEYFKGVQEQIDLFEKAIEQAKVVGPGDPRFAEAQRFVVAGTAQVETLRKSEMRTWTGEELNFKKIGDKLAALARERAQKMLADAVEDPVVLRSLIGEVAAAPGAFPPETLRRLRAATPEGIQARKVGEEKGKAAQEDARQLLKKEQGERQGELRDIVGGLVTGSKDEFTVAIAQGIVDQLDPIRVRANIETEVAKRLKASGVSDKELGDAVTSVMRDIFKEFRTRDVATRDKLPGLDDQEVAREIVEGGKRAVADRKRQADAQRAARELEKKAPKTEEEKALDAWTKQKEKVLGAEDIERQGAALIAQRSMVRTDKFIEPQVRKAMEDKLNQAIVQLAIEAAVGAKMDPAEVRKMAVEAPGFFKVAAEDRFKNIMSAMFAARATGEAGDQPRGVMGAQAARMRQQAMEEQARMAVAQGEPITPQARARQAAAAGRQAKAAAKADPLVKKQQAMLRKANAEFQKKVAGVIKKPPPPPRRRADIPVGRRAKGFGSVGLGPEPAGGGLGPVGMLQNQQAAGAAFDEQMAGAIHDLAVRQRQIEAQQNRALRGLNDARQTMQNIGPP